MIMDDDVDSSLRISVKFRKFRGANVFSIATFEYFLNSSIRTRLDLGVSGKCLKRLKMSFHSILYIFCRTIIFYGRFSYFDWL